MTLISLHFITKNFDLMFEDLLYLMIYFAKINYLMFNLNLHFLD